MGTYVGIDVSKDRLDVHILPQDEAFAVERNGAGLAALVKRLTPLLPSLVVVEATGGFESTTAAVLAWRWFTACRYQSGTGSPLRASPRQACQDRPDRREGHCSLRRRR